MDRKEIQKKLIKQLKEWEPEIQELKASAIKTKDEVRESFLKALDDYKKKEKQLLLKLEAFETASEEALNDLTEGLEKVLKDLKKTYEKMAAHFK